MGRIDLPSAPAKYLGETSKKWQRCDIIERAFDSAKGFFVLLIRIHETGELLTVPAHRVTVGASVADLGV
jgi:hypothetical protein